MRSGSASVIDPHVLQILEQHIGRPMVVRLVTLFRETAPARLSLLPEICATENFAALRRMAHDWVSDASSVGAKELSETARRIETQALLGDATVFDAARELEPLAYAASAALAEHIGENQ